jgi:tRNA A-37 threonylcarbamoyl transferase component Bud32
MPPTRTTEPGAPTPEELRAYSEGRLETARFDAVDRWIAAQDPGTQERILSATESAGSLAVAAEVVPPAGDAPFGTDLGAGSRFVRDCPIGAGGMGIVELVHDRVLGREVVVKRCRPRRPTEAVSAYSRRQQLFKREARLTAQLEHPGIVPVHDVGEGPLGEPAFTMKRLEGEPLSAIVARRRAGEELDVQRVVEIVLRVADAVGYAHSRGIVHRDLKPENIIVGALGAVYVIDWGLAGTVGAVPSAEPDASPSGTLTGSGMGTPAWMAPEQFGLVKANPRMDVFAIGGLLMATLTGRGPRDRGVTPGSPQVNLQPLEARLPRGLVAVARRCLELAPAKRYLDASAVASDLRRWLAAGLTSAENPGRMTRVLNTVRRSRKLSAALIGATAAAVLLAVGLVWWGFEAQARARAEVADIQDHVQPNDLDALRSARLRAQDVLRRFPGLPTARQLDNFLARQIQIREDQQRQAKQFESLRQALASVKLLATWPGEIDDLTTALQWCNVTLKSDRFERDAEQIRASPRREDLLTALAYLQRANVVHCETTPLTAAIPRLIEAAAPDSAWRGLADLLVEPALDGHDLALPDRPEALAAASAAPRTADLVLALFAPDHPPPHASDDDDEPQAVRPSLQPLINARLRAQSNDFWANVAAARAALVQSDYASVLLHASVALGAGTDRLNDEVKVSIWPYMLLAYSRFADGDANGTLYYALQAYELNTHHAEAIALRAEGMAALGHPEDAQNLINRSGAGSILRWHLHNRSGLPIERVLDKLVALGVEIPAADATFGPLAVPGEPDEQLP